MRNEQHPGTASWFYRLVIYFFLIRVGYRNRLNFWHWKIPQHLFLVVFSARVYKLYSVQLERLGRSSLNVNRIIAICMRTLTVWEYKITIMLEKCPIFSYPNRDSERHYFGNISRLPVSKQGPKTPQNDLILQILKNILLVQQYFFEVSLYFYVFFNFNQKSDRSNVIGCSFYVGIIACQICWSDMIRAAADLQNVVWWREKSRHRCALKVYLHSTFWLIYDPRENC